MLDGDRSKERRGQYIHQYLPVWLQRCPKWLLYLIVGSFLFFASYSILGASSSLSLGLRMNKPIPIGLCIFDIAVLMSEVDYQKFPGALAAQEFCLQKGFELAVVAGTTSESTSSETIDKLEHFPFEKHFLMSHFPSVWTSARANSLALQVHDGHMARSLALVTSSFQVRARCSVMISSNYIYEADAELLGISFFDVKVGMGVTEGDATAGIILAEDTCSQEKVRPVCSDVPPDHQYTCGRQKKWGKCQEAWMADTCCHTCHDCSCGRFILEEAAASARDRNPNPNQHHPITGQVENLSETPQPPPSTETGP